MAVFLPFLESILRVLLPFIWGEVAKERTATVIEATDADERIIDKIKALPRAFPR